MIPKLKIANRLIGPNYEPLVIAELGINHGGSLDVAIAMVDEAKRVGVEVIKHQTHIPEDEMSSAAKHIIPQPNISSHLSPSPITIFPSFNL